MQAGIVVGDQVEVRVAARTGERRDERAPGERRQRQPDEDERPRRHRSDTLPGGIDAAGATPGGRRGEWCENTLAATPYRAFGEGGRSGHGRLLPSGTAAQAAVIQLQNGQRHPESGTCTVPGAVPCTATPRV